MFFAGDSDDKFNVSRYMTNSMHIVAKDQRPLPPQPAPLFDILEEQAARIGHQTCLEFDERTLTFSQLHDEGNRIGTALQERGVKSGDPVMLMIGNRAEIAVAYVGIARIGAISVPVNTALKGVGLAHVFNMTNAAVLIAEACFVDRIEAALNGRGSIKRLVVVGDEDVPKDAERWEQLVLSGACLNQVPIRPSNPWAVMFTSGTTGPAKGAIEPHQMLSSLSWDAVQNMEVDSESIFYTFNPLFHINAVTYGFGTAIMSGSKAVIRGGFPRSDLLDDLKRRGATHMLATSFVLMGLLAAPEMDSDSNHSLKGIGSIGMSPEACARFERRFGVPVMLGYGTSEAGLVSSFCRTRSINDKSSGRPNDRYEMRIIDEFGKPLPAGQMGEVVTRARQPFDMMLGYYNDPAASNRALINGWFRTGDRGYLDQEGFFYFVDRAKESIKRRGENISSFEVEMVLMKYPGIRAVAVVPYKDTLSGEEEVRAFLILQPGMAETFDIAELVAFCGSHMAYFMVPRYFDIENDLPRITLEKIDKFKLRESPLTERTQDVKKLGLTVVR